MDTYYHAGSGLCPRKPLGCDCNALRYDDDMEANFITTTPDAPRNVQQQEAFLLEDSFEGDALLSTHNDHQQEHSAAINIMKRLDDDDDDAMYALLLPLLDEDPHQGQTPPLPTKRSTDPNEDPDPELKPPPPSIIILAGPGTTTPTRDTLTLSTLEQQQASQTANDQEESAEELQFVYDVMMPLIKDDTDPELPLPMEMKDAQEVRDIKG